MHGDPELVCLGELGTCRFACQNPARLFAHGTGDLAAILFDELARFVAVHVRERSCDDCSLPLEQSLDNALEFRRESECYEFVNFVRVKRRVEKFVNGFSDAFTDVSHVLQFFDSRCADFFERAEMLCDVTGTGAADKADAETVQQVFETALF